MAQNATPVARLWLEIEFATMDCDRAREAMLEAWRAQNCITEKAGHTKAQVKAAFQQALDAEAQFRAACTRRNQLSRQWRGQDESIAERSDKSSGN